MQSLSLQFHDIFKEGIKWELHRKAESEINDQPQFKPNQQIRTMAMKINLKTVTVWKQIVTILAVLLLLSSCSFIGGFFGSDPYEAGMEAYQEKDYEKAVEELSQVKTTHEHYDNARITLAKSKFKIHLNKFREAATSAAATEHLRQMFNYAKQAESKEAFKELLDESLASLKKAKDSQYVKALLASTVAVLKEHGDLAEVKEILKVMAVRMRDFLTDRDVRGSFMKALKEVKMLGD